MAAMKVKVYNFGQDKFIIPGEAGLPHTKI
jgi:hypothetical protein